MGRLPDLSVRSAVGPAVLALALSVIGTGCFTYTQVSPAAVPPGSSVRISVAQHTPTTTISDATLPAEGQRQIRCRLLPSTTPDTLLCAVKLGGADPLIASQDLLSTELVPLAAVQRMEVRRLQKGRTAAAIAAATVLGFVVVDWAFGITLPNKEGGDGPGGVNNTRLGRFHLRW